MQLVTAIANGPVVLDGENHLVLLPPWLLFMKSRSSGLAIFLAAELGEQKNAKELKLVNTSEYAAVEILAPGASIQTLDMAHMAHNILLPFCAMLVVANSSVISPASHGNEMTTHFMEEGNYLDNSVNLLVHGFYLQHELLDLQGTIPKFESTLVKRWFSDLKNMPTVRNTTGNEDGDYIWFQRTGNGQEGGINKAKVTRYFNACIDSRLCVRALIYSSFVLKRSNAILKPKV